ncbi:MAG: rod shape-determining protein, partial [Lachnospiraceae bacterium]|nr:rod shape-determining protein [Lachnospiraceae bacterium]
SFDTAIINHLKNKHKLVIGERTAEEVKIRVGCCFKPNKDDVMDVSGRSTDTARYGLPTTVQVTSEETEEALKEPTQKIVEAIKTVLEVTPPELAADIKDRGIVLTGGGSLLRGLEELISDATGITTMTAEDPMTAVAIGTGKYVEFIASYRG